MREIVCGIDSPTAAITLPAQANLARAESQLLDADRLYRESIARDATYPDVREDLTELLTDVGHLREAEREGRELCSWNRPARCSGSGWR